jgi:hypothetical protein
MKRILFLGFVVLFSACSLYQKKQPQTAAEAPKEKHQVAQGETKFVPSGTEIEFHGSKKFTVSDTAIKIEMSPSKKCSLYVHMDKDAVVEINDNTMLTVVGYRAETNEIVMSDANYHQYALSCLEKTAANTVVKKSKKSARATSSVTEEWKKTTVELEDLRKLAPTLKVKFVPM